MKTNEKIINDKAITIISLVITIILLLILAGITINMLIGENGIIAKANSAKEKTDEAQGKEEIELANLENKISEYQTIKSSEITKTSNILFDGAMHSGTITFENNSINDYGYYEFIFGVANKARILSQIVTKEYIKLPMNDGDLKYVAGVAGASAMCTIMITNVTENSITFQADASGSSWASETGYIYQIIGRNNL